MVDIKRALWLSAALVVAVWSFQAAAQNASRATDLAGKIYPIPDDSKYLRWPLPPSEAAYARIDGSEIKTMVSELSAISRKDRDRGVQFWGRNAGTPADKDTQEWLLAKFKKAGLSNVHLQEFDLPPHWYPNSWDANVTGGGATTPLKSIRPFLWSNPTPPGGLMLEPVWISLGNPADLIGRDLKGKVAFILAIPEPGMRDNSQVYNGAMKRAQDAGAAAIVVALQLPGNVSSEMITSAGVTVPNFSIGMADMLLVRKLIEDGRSPKVTFHLNTEMVKGEKTATVWGELPGATDENMLIMAHTDAFFDGALDNNSGVAMMVALAKYYAKIPKDQRRRTIRFAGIPAHHLDENKPADLPLTGSEGTLWMAANKDTFFAKTALIINLEHVAQTAVEWLGPDLIAGNTTSPLPWSAYGSDKFKNIVFNALQENGVAIFAIPEDERRASTPPRPPRVGPAKPTGGNLQPVEKFAPSMELIDRILYHTELDTDEYVPATGLERVGRAYARIIDDVNKAELKDLKAPPSKD